LLLGLAVVLAPLLVIDVPPLLDYPNHLARAYVLSGDDPLLRHFYQPHWALIPNLGLDLLLPQLMTWLPVHVAGRLILAFSLVLPVIGVVAYSRAVFGQATWWSLGALLVACNGTFLLGFLNFQLAIGLALLFAASWVRFRQTRPAMTIALCTIGVGALFFCHLMGVLALLLLVGAHEITRPAPVRRALLAAPLVLVPAALFMASALRGVSTEIQWQTWSQKLLRAAYGVLNYDIRLDILSAVAIAGLIVLLTLQRRMSIPASSRWALALCAALYLATPFTFKGTLFTDVRFAALFGFLLFATMRPVRLPRRLAYGMAACAAALLMLRTTVVADVWYQHRADLAQLRAAIAPVPPGSRVLLATVSQAEAQAAWHGPLQRELLSDGTRLDMHSAALLLIERRAFWPFLFAEASQQPIALRWPYSEIAAQTVNIPDTAQLTAPAMRAGDEDVFPMEGHWQCCYDYVLLLEAGAAPAFADPLLTPVVQTAYASLFKVVGRISAASSAIAPTQKSSPAGAGLSYADPSSLAGRSVPW
jgi:hypothetical protein